jgi:hypothetical protein
MKYEDIRLEAAENGFILHYCEVSKPEGSDAFENCRRKYHQRVYPFAKVSEVIAEMMKMIGKKSDISEKEEMPISE